MKTYILLFIGLLTITQACPDQDPLPDSEIKLINNSDHTILHYFDLNSYPDTMLSNYNYFSDQDQLEYASINPNDSITVPGYFIDYFSQGAEALILFLFIKGTVLSVDWETIREEYLILKRYDLTLSDLDSLDWTITYPEQENTKSSLID